MRILLRDEQGTIAADLQGDQFTIESNTLPNLPLPRAWG
jgi:hypothetical protein